MKFTTKAVTILTVGIIATAMIFPVSVSGASKPAKVKGLKTVSATTSAALSWKETENAEGYIVYINDGKGYKAVKNTKSLSYTRKKLVPNRTYSFRVRGYCRNKGKYVFGKCSSARTAKTTVPSVSVTAKSLTGSVSLLLKKAAGVSGYQIYRNDKLLKTLKGYTYSDKTGTSEETYKYKARAYKTFKGKRYYGQFSQIVKAYKITSLAAPSVSATTEKNSGKAFVSLKWNEIPEATGYKVYRKNTGGEYKLLYFTQNPYYADSEVSDTTEYTYSVVAYRKVSESVVRTGVSGECMVIVSGNTAPETTPDENVPADEPAVGVPSSAKAESITYSSAKLSWSSVSDCEGYKIYNSDGKIIKSTTNTYCTVSNLDMGTSYTYSLRAYRGDKTGDAKSVTFATKDIQPSELKTEDITYTTAVLKWTADSLADGYMVYDSAGNLLSKQTGTSYSVSGLESLKSYTYKVSAYKGSHEGQKISLTFKTKGLAKPNLSVSVTAFSAILKWNKVEGAESYVIYKKDCYNKNAYECTTTASTSYTDYNLCSNEWYEYTVYAVSGNARSEGSTVKKTTSLHRSKDESTFPVDKRAKLAYSGDGSDDRYTIYLGGKWSSSVYNGLAKHSSGEASYSRPKLYSLIYPEDEDFNVTSYCFDTGDYDNFLQVNVSEGQIIEWFTSSSVFGSFEGHEVKRGDTGIGIYNADNMFYQTKSMASAAWGLDYEEGAALIGGFSVNGLYLPFEIPGLIAKNENRIGAHWINAARVLHGRNPLTYSTVIEGDGKTYGAQAFANTMYISEECGHNAKPSGPLAGKTAGERLSDVYKATGTECLYPLSENVATGIIGEVMLTVYNDSIGHLGAIMGKTYTHIGCGFTSGYHCQQFAQEYHPNGKK